RTDGLLAARRSLPLRPLGDQERSVRSQVRRALRLREGPARNQEPGGGSRHGRRPETDEGARKRASRNEIGAMKHLLIPFLGALTLAVSDGEPAASPAKEAAGKRPNILFLITDDQFKQHMNWMPEGKQANGKFRNFTPHTDRLA